jgi:hypothetical protein
MTDLDTHADATPVVDPAPVNDDSAAPVADAANATDPANDSDAADPVAEAVKKATNKANREAQNLRKRLKELEDAEQERKDAALSETELLKKQLAEAADTATKAREAAQAAALRAAVAVEAGKLNIVDADAALALLNRDGIEHSDDGTVTGVTEALTALAEAKPYLIESKPVNPRLDANNGGRSDAAELTPQQQTAQLLRGRRGPSIWG